MLNKKIQSIGLVILTCLLTLNQISAAPNVGVPIRKFDGRVKKMAGGCAPATASVDLDINNVRARILNGGDMWWDLVGTARYEIPKVTETNAKRKNSLFAGSLWIGGFERSNLKLAAMTYRQNGSDFFPGALDTVDASINAEQCVKYDKIWKLNKTDVDNFRLGTEVSDNILTWPGNPIDVNKRQGRFLAPYVEVDNVPGYTPSPTGGATSDYPDIKGDQALWFVYNDQGNIHSETNSTPIGLECRTMAFAFKSNDQISNMTFYKNTVINRGRGRLDSCYFGQWVDADLGYAFDDYVGCDTTLDLGICYNGEDNDPGETGYGLNPPSIGVDFFQGPKADDSDKVDNNHNGIVDEPGETIGMSKFVYYNNDFTNFGNPTLPEHYYGYLVGKWKTGNRITKFSGTSNGTGQQAGFPKADYMFPGDPTSNNKSEWTERNAGNPFGDRRFIQSAGPFTLLPGAVNNVTIGVVWARATSGGAIGSIGELKFADKKAQILFNANFNSILGPEPPSVEFSELDKKLVLTLYNNKGSLDSTERYDRFLPSEIPGKKRHYKFEGYQVFQLANSSVTSADLDNVDKARLVYQCDKVNGITILVNEDFDQDLGTVKKLKVKGEDKGIKHVFELTKDYFSSGDDALVNNRFYYYLVVAYAANTSTDEKEKYLAGRPAEISGVYQLRAIPHRLNEQLFGNILRSEFGTQVPITRLEGTGNGGLNLDFDPSTEAQFFGANPKSIVAKPLYLTGAGPIDVRVYDPLRVPNFDFEFKINDTAVKGLNPINKVRLVDSQSKWTLYNRTAGYTGNLNQWTSNSTINIINEQVIPELGMVVNIRQPNGPAYERDSIRNDGNGLLEATMTFKNPTDIWLTGIFDQETPPSDAFKKGLPWPQNWIRAGNQSFATNTSAPIVVDDYKAPLDASYPSPYIWGYQNYIDPRASYEKMLGGIIAPAALAARSFNGANGDYSSVLTMGPMPQTMKSYTLKGPGKGNTDGISTLNNLGSVDIVFTPDKSKWTKSIVFEMCEDPTLSEGGAVKFGLRKAANPFIETPNGPVYAPGQNTEMGTSWFPGYAIDVETGERLNIIFGEDSYLQTENGRDMLWNPTNNYAAFNYQNPASLIDPTAFITRYLWGGKHWFYVMGARTRQNMGVLKTTCFDPLRKSQGGKAYDSCKTYYNILKDGSSCFVNSDVQKQYLISIMHSAYYTMCPVLTPRGKLNSVTQGIVPNETRIRIRIAKPYANLLTGAEAPEDIQNNGMPRYSFSTKSISPDVAKTTGSEYLKDITITPNPYYAFSFYETSQLDNRVRIANLPPACKITIYSLDGSVIRRYNVAQPSYSEVNPRTQSYLDWDMKNEARVPVSSGVYLIQVDAGALGTRVLKWFGIMRPIDLDTF